MKCIPQGSLGHPECKIPTKIDQDEHEREFGLARFWGSRASRYQRTTICPFESLEAAQIAAGRLIEQKLRRGYRIISTADH